MGEDVLRIEKLENGYEVEVRDPKIDAANQKPKADWKSPWKAYAFSTSGEVVAFVSKHLDSLPKSSQDEFNDAAATAFAEKD